MVTSVRELNISHNPMLQIDDESRSASSSSPVVINSSSLEILDMTGVDLGHVSPVLLSDLLERFPRLRQLHLAFTRLKSLRPSSRWSRALQLVDLARNSIVDGQFACGELLAGRENLTRVILAHNRFTSFSGFVRTCLSANSHHHRPREDEDERTAGLVYFDLSFNQIESLNGLVSDENETTMTNGNLMLRLNLSGNPLVRIKYRIMS